MHKSWICANDVVFAAAHSDKPLATVLKKLNIEVEYSHAVAICTINHHPVFS